MRYLLLIIAAVIFACTEKNQYKVDVSNVEINLNIKRFDEQYYTSSSQKLPALKAAYPYLFPKETPDSIWLQKIIDEKPLFEASQKLFKDFSEQKKALENLFKHVKYYQPTFYEPTIHTLITGLDYENRVIYNKNFLFIALDLYLAAESEFYNQLPAYLSKNFNKERLVVDVAEAIAVKQFKPEDSRQFIAKIINEGKKLHLMQRYLPNTNPSLIMGYTKEELAWVRANETMIWKYFVDKSLLYSTDSNLYLRFIADAPFSKFYLEIDNDSPGRIGAYLGWRIVEAYAKKHSQSLSSLLATDAMILFEKSNYKPQKT